MKTEAKQQIRIISSAAPLPLLKKQPPISALSLMLLSTLTQPTDMTVLLTTKDTSSMTKQSKSFANKRSFNRKPEQTLSHLPT